MQSHAGAAVLTLIDTRLSFCIPFRIQKVSDDLHYLLARRHVSILWHFSLININQPKTHFPLKCFSLICITLKVLNKVTSLWNKGAVGYKKESTQLKDLMLLLVFSIYQLYQQIKDMKTWQQVLAQQ